MEVKVEGIGKAIGRLRTPVIQNRFEVVLYSEVSRESRSLLGRFVAVPFALEGRRGVLVGRVMGWQLEGDVGRDPRPMDRLGPKAERTHRIFERGTRLVLDCKPVSAFSEEGRRVPLDFTIPPAAEVYLASDELFEGIFSRVEGLFSLGRFYGAGVKHWVYLRDFSTLGEAYHTLVAGQTGSGKSTLVQMLLLGYAKASREMNFFILDPVGEFSRAFQGEAKGHFRLDLPRLWRGLGRRSPQLYGLDGLALGRWDILKVLLAEEKAFELIGVRGSQHQQDAASRLVDRLKAKGVALNRLEEAWPFVLETVRDPEFVQILYAGAEGRGRVAQFTESEARLSDFQEAFLRVARLFSSRERLSIPALIARLLAERGQTVVVDLSERDWGDPVKYLLIGEILHQLYRKALERYRKTGEADFNTLVVLDEAHRVAPQDRYMEESDHAREAKRATVQAFVETRKFGLGWLVISTRLSLLDRKLFEHARIKILGYGLGTGADGDLLRETYGREFLELYNTLPDPVDPLMERTHAFAVDGPITLLSKGVPELLEVYSKEEEFLGVNGLEVAGQEEARLLDWKGGVR